MMNSLKSTTISEKITYHILHNFLLLWSMFTASIFLFIVVVPNAIDSWNLFLFISITIVIVSLSIYAVFSFFYNKQFFVFLPNTYYFKINEDNDVSDGEFNHNYELKMTSKKEKIKFFAISPQIITEDKSLISVFSKSKERFSNITYSVHIDKIFMTNPCPKIVYLLIKDHKTLKNVKSNMVSEIKTYMENTTDESSIRYEQVGKIMDRYFDADIFKNLYIINDVDV